MAHNADPPPPLWAAFRAAHCGRGSCQDPAAGDTEAGSFPSGSPSAMTGETNRAPAPRLELRGTALPPSLPNHQPGEPAYPSLITVRHAGGERRSASHQSERTTPNTEPMKSRTQERPIEPLPRDSSSEEQRYRRVCQTTSQICYAADILKDIGKTSKSEELFLTAEDFLLKAGVKVNRYRPVRRTGCEALLEDIYRYTSPASGYAKHSLCSASFGTALLVSGVWPIARDGAARRLPLPNSPEGLGET
ncbi:hypothetical protein UY3_18914 [Chelonia mydas]|uniref:Uncharacterized protein n=1 Tax=Chelonia mydas TaxID=8469 RepID=M7AGE5_CHEMY|nr:hypothetical protein UY3_18914 [Chelonia mydas]